MYLGTGFFRIENPRRGATRGTTSFGISLGARVQNIPYVLVAEIQKLRDVRC
jgi:hypothetical protein